MSPAARAVLVVALLGAAGSSAADELDLNGNWLLSMSCGLTPVVLTWNITEDVTTGVTAIVDSDCGSFDVGGGPTLMSGCSYSPTPLPGLVTGSTFASPETGVTYRTTLLSPPLGYLSCAGAAKIVTDLRSDASIVDDGAGRGIRMTGVITLGTSSFYDVNDVFCDSVSGGNCTYVALRSDVATGTNQSVVPREDTTVTFDTVTAPGFVTVTPLATPTGVIPPNFQLVDTPLYYDVATTATVSGPIKVCLPYPDADDDGFVDGTTSPVDETTLLLLHEEGGTFVNRTIPSDPPAAPNPDPVANVVCAETSSLSQFVFGASTIECGNAVADAGEDCDEGAGINGASGSCCSATCTYLASGAACRASLGECDPAETCSGTSVVCPADVVLPSSQACTADSNPCTADHCDGAGGCVHPAVADGTDCDDGLACDGADKCLAGACLHADNQCTTPLPLDAYKCHKVKDLKSPAFAKIQHPGVSLDDAFGPDADAAVLKPVLVCNPASLEGSSIADPTAYLCCYKIKGQPLAPRPRVAIADGFGSLQLEAVKPQVLCRPCTETPL